MTANPEPQIDRQWYAIHIRSNQERNTAQLLKDRSVEVFLPLYREKSKRIDRSVTLKRPLFTGYLFAHIDLLHAEKVEVLKAPGSVRIVGFGNRPTPIPDEVIESVKILVGNGEDQVRPHPLIRVGQTVRVIDGPFRGALGRLHCAANRKSALVVEIEFLGRAVSVPVAPEQVSPVVV